MTAMDIVAKVTDMFSHDKNVRSLEKKTFGSTFVGTLRIFSVGASFLGPLLIHKLLKNDERRES